MKAIAFPIFAAFVMVLAGCESTPVTPESAIPDRAQATLNKMITADSGLRTITDKSYAYAIFPEVGAAALGVGGACGMGVVYQNGKEIGVVVLNQGSIGLQLGGDTYSELIVFDTPEAFDSFRNGKLEFGADASATIIKAGSAASAPFNHATRIFAMPKGGLMAGISVSGQKFTFTPASSNNNL